MKDAAAYALNRNIDFKDLQKPLDEDNIKVRGTQGSMCLGLAVPCLHIPGFLGCGTSFLHPSQSLHATSASVCKCSKYV